LFEKPCAVLKKNLSGQKIGVGSRETRTSWGVDGSGPIFLFTSVFLAGLFV
jgi:hypothetical protein